MAPHSKKILEKAEISVEIQLRKIADKKTQKMIQNLVLRLTFLTKCGTL